MAHESNVPDFGRAAAGGCLAVHQTKIDFHFALIFVEGKARFKIAEQGFSYSGGTYRDRSIVPDPTIDDLHEPLDYALENGMTFKADTIDGLAKLIGLDAATLSESIERYNGFCATGVDDGFSEVSIWAGPTDEELAKNPW